MRNFSSMLVKRILRKENKIIKSFCENPKISSMMRDIYQELSALTESHNKVIDRRSLNQCPKFIYPYHVSEKMNEIHIQSKSESSWSCAITEEEISNCLEKYAINPLQIMRSISFSKDGKFVSVVVDVGEELTHCIVKRLNSSDPLFLIENVMNAVWAGNESLVFTRQNNKLRPDKVAVAQMKENTNIPEIFDLFVERDQEFVLDVSVSKDRGYMFVTSQCRIASEVIMFKISKDGRLDTLTSNIIHSRTCKSECFVTASGPFLYRLESQNDGKQRFSRMRLDESGCWHDILSVDPDRDHGNHIKDISVLRNHIVVLKADGIYYSNITCISWTKVQLPWKNIESGEFLLNINEDESCDYIEFSWESPIHTRRMYTFDLVRGILSDKSLGFAEEGLPNLSMERCLVPVSPNLDIPVTIVQTPHASHQGPRRKFLVMAYGSYGLGLDMQYNTKYFPLISRGFTLAFVHIRGGGEGGRRWYEEGRLFQKKNGIRDLEKVCLKLKGVNEVGGNSLVGLGVSAGAVPFASLYNTQPNLFDSLIFRVPLMDPYSLMQEPDLPLNSIEFQEWGNLQSCAKAKAYLKTYSPTENLTANPGQTTNVLVSASLNDQRIPFWQPLEWIRKRRSLGEDSNIYLRMEEGNLFNNHFALSGSVGQTCLEWAFAVNSVYNKMDQ